MLHRHHPGRGPAGTIDDALLQRGIDFGTGQDDRLRAECANDTVIRRRAADLAAGKVARVRQGFLGEKMIAGHAGAHHRQHLEAVLLLVEAIDVVPHTRLAPGNRVNLDRIHRQRQPAFTRMEHRVRIEHVEDTRCDRLQLLEDRHHLGTAYLDLDGIAADRLDVFDIALEDRIRGLLRRVETRQQPEFSSAGSSGKTGTRQNARGERADQRCSERAAHGRCASSIKALEGWAS